MKKDNKLKYVGKIGKIILNVLFYTFIAFMLIFSIANIRKKTNAEIPNIFGRGFLSVQSDSMDGNKSDSFKQGDLLFVKIIKEKDIAKLQIGDIVTFYDKRIKAINTHRIVDYSEDRKFFVTQGDKKAMERAYDSEHPENNDSNTYETIHASEVIAKHTSTWKGAGTKLDYIQDPKGGFALVIVLPTAILFATELFILIRSIMKMNREKLEAKHAEKLIASEEELQKRLEAEREAMRQELLKELQKKEVSNNKD